MATLDRIEPAFVPWTPSVSGIGITDDAAAEEYVGRHRRGGRRSFFATMFYAARHRRR
jgi:hypothetical protein